MHTMYSSVSTLRLFLFHMKYTFSVLPTGREKCSSEPTQREQNKGYEYMVRPSLFVKLSERGAVEYTDLNRG